MKHIRVNLMMIRIYLALLAIAGLIAAAPSHAVPITMGFGGTLTDDPYGVLGSDFSFSGSYTFESSAADLVADAATGVYHSTGPAYGFQSLVAGTNYSIADSLFVNVANGYAGSVDQYGVLASDGLLTLELFFQDNDAAVFSSDALPGALALTPFELANFRLFGNGIEFLGRIENLTCLHGCEPSEPEEPIGVPEPGSGLLMLAALGAFGFARRRHNLKLSGRPA